MKPLSLPLFALLLALTGCATVPDSTDIRPLLPDRWVIAASAVSRVFETGTPAISAYDSISGDFDGQGMSVGTMQWNMGQGSIKRLLQRVTNLDAMIAATMPRYGAEFGRNAMAPPAQGLAYARGLQTDQPTWVAFQAELKAFLNTPQVRQAQLALEHEAAREAWRLATEFERTTHPTTPVSFPEFAFFYDLTVQGGSGYMRELLPVMHRFVDQQGTSAREAAISRARTSAGFVSMKEDAPCVRPTMPRSESGSARGAHLWDGQQNCVTWREMLQRDELSFEQQLLLSVTMLRSFLAVDSYAQNFFNRKGLLVTGIGHANGRRCDIRPIYAQLERGEEVSPAEIAGQCVEADQIETLPAAMPPR